MGARCLVIATTGIAGASDRQRCGHHPSGVGIADRAVIGSGAPAAPGAWCSARAGGGGERDRWVSRATAPRIPPGEPPSTDSPRWWIGSKSWRVAFLPMPRRTLESTVELAGVGLHTGAQVTIRCRPAPGGSGIVFRRTDLAEQPRIPARLDSVGATARRTQLRRNGITLDTVEHLLAAVAAEQLDDLLVDVNGPELPILDGSFQPCRCTERRRNTTAGGGAGSVATRGIGPVSGWRFGLSGGAMEFRPVVRNHRMAASVDRSAEC